MKRGVVWFRNDLRITDNEALTRAVRECEEILPVYIFDTTYLKAKEFGSSKFGTRRVQFILESLNDLKYSLGQLGGTLRVEVGNPSKIIGQIAETFAATDIYVQKEVMSEELKQEKLISTSTDCEVHFFHGHNLYHPQDIPFDYRGIPDVFSAFRKKCEKLASVRPILNIPKALKSPQGFGTDIPSLKELGFQERAISHRAAIRFKGGEREARKRLDHYFWSTENLSVYKQTRNGLLGVDYSSKFSAWLSTGCISPRVIYAQVKRYEKLIKKNSSTYWLVFELIWRDYFWYVGMKYGDTLFHSGGIRVEKPPTNPNQEIIDAWKAGETGVPFIDANMKELNETGFMSNRGRQNVASYLVKDLQQDWRYGAAYFEQELIDYDVTSNWGNWAYVAGVGNDPRENRYFNVLTQANRYDEKGGYVKNWLPELTELPKEWVQRPWQLSDSEKRHYGIDQSIYAKPIYVNEHW